MAFYTDGVPAWNSLDDNTRAPLASELEGGYPCGEADQQLFNWTAGWPVGNIWNMILQGGITPDTDKLLDLARAIQSGKVNYAVAGGTANALTATLSPVPASLINGFVLRLKVSTANTGAATLNVNGLGAKTIVYADGTGVAAGELVAARIAELVYDGTNFVLTNPWTALMRLSPKGAKQTRAFTQNVALADLQSANVNTIVQTITVTGTSYLDCMAYCTFKNENSSFTNMTGWLQVTQAGAVISTGDYLGVANKDSFQTPITIRERFYNLDPALTYVVNLVVKKSSAVGPVVIQDTRILALHE